MTPDVLTFESTGINMDAAKEMTKIDDRSIPNERIFDIMHRI